MTVIARPEAAAWKAGRRAASLLGTVLAAAATVAGTLAIIVALATHLGPAGQFTAFGHPVMKVLSGSMTPVIKTGDLIVDRPVTAAQAQHLRPGQVISFRAAPGSPVIITHRIVAVRRHGGSVSYLTKGDANRVPDTAPRPAADVVGVFWFAIRDGGYVLTALHRPLVLALLLAAPVLWMLAGPLYRIAARMDAAGGRPAEGEDGARPDRGRHHQSGG